MRWNAGTSMKMIVRAVDLVVRRARVVTETDSEMLGSCLKIAREIDDLPAPEGEASTIMTPRRANSAMRLLQVLHLLAELVDHRLEVEADRRQLHGVGFGAEGIRFAVKFL